MATYSDEERIAALAALAANGGNISKTSRETKIPRITLRKWQASELNELPQVATLKKELVESYLDKAKRVRETLLDRMAQVAETETDLFKLSGAFKTVSDAASQEEVNNAVASRIRGPRAVSESTPTPGIDSAGGPGSAGPAFN